MTVIVQKLHFLPGNGDLQFHIQRHRAAAADGVKGWHGRFSKCEDTALVSLDKSQLAIKLPPPFIGLTSNFL